MKKLALHVAAVVVTTVFAVPAQAQDDLQLTISAGHLAGVGTPAWLPSTLPEAPTVEARTTVFGLPQNVGTMDRILRGVVAATLIGVGTWAVVSDDVSDGTGAALLSVAAVPAATGATGYCPLYHLLGIDTTF